MTSYNYYWPPGPSSGYAIAPCPIQQQAPAVQSRSPGPPQTTVMQPPVAAASQALGQGIFLKAINPMNKKDWQDYTLRGISRETMDTPEKLRQTITDQCGEGVVPEEIGYFEQATKHWIHNRLDMADVWNKIEGGAKITLWCMRNESVVSKSRSKRGSTEDESNTEKKKQKLCSSKELAEEHEQELQEKHGSKYTRFQYKLWAEMLASGVHNDMGEPPAASMFTRGTKQQKQPDAVVSGMMSVVNTLCQAVTSKQSTATASASPVKRAELRSKYIQQLSELRQLFDNDILSPDEYEEQRLHIVSLMRELK